MYETYVSGNKKSSARGGSGMDRGRTASYEAEDALSSFASSSEMQKAKDRSATISFGSSIIAASPASVSRKSPTKVERAESLGDEDRTPTFSEWGSGLKSNQGPNNPTMK